MITLALPEMIGAQSALLFCRNLSKHVTESSIVIDFGELRSSEPFGLLFLGAALRTYFHERKFRGVSAAVIRAGDAALEHLAHVGFFQWIGIPVGKLPGAVDGSTTWLPVTT